MNSQQENAVTVPTQAVDTFDMTSDDDWLNDSPEEECTDIFVMLSTFAWGKNLGRKNRGNPGLYIVTNTMDTRLFLDDISAEANRNFRTERFEENRVEWVAKLKRIIKGGKQTTTTDFPNGSMQRMYFL
jgi:hypothetical protein